MEQDALEDALELLGSVLADRGVSYEVVVIGGSALLLLGVIQRPTKDLDVLALVEEGVYLPADPLPGPLRQAVRDVGLALGLTVDWLNGGPTAQLRSGLPPGFASRVETRVYGALAVHIASRLDHIFLKLFAAVDHHGRGKHADDLRRLAPTKQELLEAAAWVRGQDIGPAFPQMVADILELFGIADDQS
jgi:hypothetical protein